MNVLYGWSKHGMFPFVGAQKIRNKVVFNLQIPKTQTYNQSL